MRSIITITVDRDKLPKHTDKEFRIWIQFQVGERGGIPLDNPLHDLDLESEVVEID